MTSTSYGFTLLELAIVIAVVGMLLMVTGPSMNSLSQTLEYREAVRELVSANQNARRTARASGSAVDLIIDASQNRFVVTREPEHLEPDNFTSLSDDLRIEVVFAQEVGPGNGMAAIRFYPAGGSSGGEISVIRPTGSGALLVIDWLLGAVT